ncbi:hypothetical protein M513_11374, partial [Trichuris suis]
MVERVPYGVSFAYPSSLTDVGECNWNQEFSDEVIEANCLPERFSDFMVDYNRNTSDAIVAHFTSLTALTLSLWLKCGRFCSKVHAFFDTAESFYGKVSELQLSTQGWEQMLDEMPGEDMIKDVRSKLYMSIFLLTNFANLFEDKEMRKACSQADNGGKTARGGRRQGGKSRANVGLSINWIQEKKRLLTSYCEILSPQLGKIFESDSSKKNMTRFNGSFARAIASLTTRFLICWSPSYQEPLFKLLLLLLENNSDYVPILAAECARCLAQPTADPAVFVSLVQSVYRVDAGRSFVTVLFMEISKGDSSDSSELTNESAAVKNYSTFLTQLAADCPDIIIHGLSSLRILRAKQSPTLRIGILNVYCELVSVKLHRENLEPRDRSLRNQLLAVMLEHLHDRNAIVRSRVLQLWKRLLIEKCIPLSTFRRLVPLVSDRVKDKSVLVRKYALLLLTALVENNPFLVELSIESISRQMQNVKADLERLQLLSESMDCTFVFHSILAIVSVLPADGISKREETEFWNRARNAAEEAVESVYNTFWKEGAFDPTGELSMAIASADNLNQDICNAFQLISVDNFEEAVTEMIAISKKYANNCYFSLMLNSELRIAGSVIYPSISEEQAPNAIDYPAGVDLLRKQLVCAFLEDCLHFATTVSSSLTVVMEMLCDNEQVNVLDAVMFMAACAERKIISRVDDCWCCWNLIWSSQKRVKVAVLSAFRRLYFQNGDKDCRDEEAAKRLIELASSANHEKRITLEKVLQESFDDNSLPKEIMHACWNAFYTKISEEERGALIALLGMMIKIDPPIFIEHITDVVTYALGVKASSNHYLALSASEALKKLGDVDRAAVRERLSMCREQTAKCKLVPRLAWLLSEGIFDCSHSVWVPIMQQAVELLFNVSKRPDVLAAKLLRSVAKAALSAPESNKNECLARLLQLVGEVAIRTVNFAHTTLIGLAQARQQQQRAGHSDQQAGECAPSSNRLDLIVEATPVEYARMSVERFVDVETLNRSSLLRPFADTVIYVCKNINLYPHQLVQCAAGIALLKLMHISSSWCSNNCQLLFNLLENSANANLRISIVQLLPDLCVRFPNELGPWIEKLFARLFDDNIQVRIACVSSVSHLILQDRIKPRIFIADMAICCMDDNPDVANMAKAFFKQYSEKEPIYSAIAFIVERLSEDGSTVDLEKFKSIMTWLFGLVCKDVQLERLVERFCQVFSGTQSLKHLEYLSCSLTLLKYNDKMVRKLLENLRSYQTKLGEKTVYENFVKLATIAAKGGSAETKLKLKNWKDELDKWHDLYASATASQENGIVQQEHNATTTADEPPSTPASVAKRTSSDSGEEHSSANASCENTPSNGIGAGGNIDVQTCKSNTFVCTFLFRSLVVHGCRSSSGFVLIACYLSRLAYMGCDGGTIPTRGELVRTKKKAAKVEREVANAARWKNCSLTQQRLKRPVVASRLGKMYNKEAVIEALIKKKTGVVFEGLDCIDSLKDVKELKLTKNPAYDTKSAEVTGSHHDSNVAEYMCPIAGVEMNGNYRFVVLWSCGCVISEKAMKEIESSTCANCGTAYSSDDVVVIYGTEEEVETYRLRVNKMRSAADTRKHIAGCTENGSLSDGSSAEKKKAKTSSDIVSSHPHEARTVTKSSNQDDPTTSKTFKPLIENGGNGSLPDHSRPQKRKLKPSSETISNQSHEARKTVKTSIQDDPTTSKTYKSLFTTSKEARERPQAHWVTGISLVLPFITPVLEKKSNGLDDHWALQFASK